jgi:2-oxoglutarate dehydrogenase E2 component (dihydrolipoamide succinyltransferase)
MSVGRDPPGRLDVSTADRGLPVPENSGGVSPSESDPVQQALGGLTTREHVAARIAARTAPLVRRPPTNGRASAPAAAPAAASAPAAAPAAASAPAAAPVVAGSATDTFVPLTPIRKRIAANLTHSLATAAHTLVVVEVDYTAVESVRVAHGLSYLPFVGRAVVDALRQYPHMNATLGDDVLIVHREINLGISVDLDFQGLVVPVVRNADGLRLTALADRFRSVAAKARARQLSADDLSGGTFTITNAGGYGTVVTGPIINPPQVAILSTDGVRMRPCAVADDVGGWSVGIRPLGNLSLSFDHRAFDGAYATAFLALVRDILVQRDWEDEV